MRNSKLYELTLRDGTKVKKVVESTEGLKELMKLVSAVKAEPVSKDTQGDNKPESI